MSVPSSAARSKADDLLITVLRLIDDAEAALATDRQSASASLGQAMALLQQADSLTNAAFKPHGGLSSWQIKRLEAYIEAHLGETIHTRDLAGVARLSASHFSHAFKHSFGETPRAHITRKRLERVREMILSSNESLSRIALACGFCDQSHLTRAFHRAMGVSPLAWRRQYAEGPPEKVAS
ncbi:helix-turn-helix domain-containing protein [Halomonas urumqiensis]|uniref:AraC family transcriptional regulator n=1 Tax=Halomonas urumqiensis TaxID=1684789 RepID=A0A2N7UMM8_9GAMM|nr:AraC family transcriptional regulator [Halomonas urumqiensis]PMR81662.1 AraC family transcriptional regulator [Halomonas urumqiensis]PTB02299.1 AraC family transcriptional regulator [Halomonas urumqiensis]GHE21767.1 hypothetical protein GCM10017767_22880 [Halomonas urumqiensis]